MLKTYISDISDTFQVLNSKHLKYSYTTIRNAMFLKCRHLYLKIIHLRTDVIVGQVQPLQFVQHTDLIRHFLQFIVPHIQRSQRLQVSQLLWPESSYIVVPN